ncbi:MAG: M17 family peptidase N-terminal domain-containing protein [Bacteriovoracia bacterium]
MTTAEDFLLDDSGARKLFVVSVLEKERPLKRVIGQLDWRLKGYLSHFVKNGWVRGASGEVVYVPVFRHQKLSGHMRHLLLVGLGPNLESAHDRGGNLFNRVTQTAKKLNFETIVISESSFPFWSKDKMRTDLNQSNLELEWVE